MNAHDGLRADTTRGQAVRERAGALVEIGVGEPELASDHGGQAGPSLRRGLDQLVQALVTGVIGQLRVRHRTSFSSVAA